MYSYLVCADYMTDLSTSRRALFRSLVSIIYLWIHVFLQAVQYSNGPTIRNPDDETCIANIPISVHIGNVIFLCGNNSVMAGDHFLMSL